MRDSHLVDPSQPIEQQNAKLRRIIESLMARVERDIDQTGNAFALFQRAIALEGEVRARTRDLERTLADLNSANRKLEAATAAAEAASRAKSRFLAAASHDVLQPLNAAKLFAGSLADGRLDEDQAQIVARLTNALGSMETILGAFLDISRLDTEETWVEESSFPIARILDPIRNDFAPLAAERSLGFTVMPSAAWVRSDPAYLRQIVQNLVSNAVRYCGTGRVLVGARRQGERIRIEVHDTGPGLTEEEIPLIFREFKRLDNAPRGAAGPEHGVGLGLAIVERAAKLLSHPLEIQSAPGKGSCFAVTVPRAETPAMPLIVPPETAAPGDSDDAMIVLVVTSSPELQETLGAHLTDWDMSALCADGKDDALGWVEQLGVAPDIALVDERLGDGAGGLEVIAALQAACGPDLRAVLLDDRDARAGGPEGAAEWIERLGKPIRPHRLRAILAPRRPSD